MRRLAFVVAVLGILGAGAGCGTECGDGTVEEDGTCQIEAGEVDERCASECRRANPGTPCDEEDVSNCAATCRLRIEGYPLTCQNCLIDTVGYDWSSSTGTCFPIMGRAREGLCADYCPAP